MLTTGLWAKTSPAMAGRLEIRGPVDGNHPVDGRAIQIFERIAVTDEGERRQILTVTQGGAALGRVQELRTGLPKRQFDQDAIFPLGLWRQGERREFEAVEFTMLGPTLRLITLEILDLDHRHDGVAHSLRYRLTIRDEARRVLNCEVSVYSPGLGLVAFEANGFWQGCDACPCPG